jgi:hypothetical protein
MDRAHIKLEVEAIIRLLVYGEFERIALLTKGVRLSAEEIKTAVEQYGQKLALPPSEAFQKMDVVKVQAANPARWSVTMPLWTEEEGRSDLSIELTIIRDGADFLIELDDIHVL